MSNRGLNLPNWREAVRHLELLTGERDPVVCFQVFNDKGKGGQGAHRHGRLSSKLIRGWLLSATKRGCGIYIVINQTDGSGRRRQNITLYLASFIDLDGTPLPDKWHQPPDLVVESSPGKHHAYWLLVPGTDVALWEDTQKRLAAYYGSDPKVCDASRVLRLAGFDHQKDKPFRVRIAAVYNLGDRYRLDAVRFGLPAVSTAIKSAAAAGTKPALDVTLDTNAAIKSARSFLANAEQGKAGERNNTAYQHACKLNDLGISRELAEEMLLDWNEMQPDPLPDSEIKHVVDSAQRYKQNPHAAAVPAEAEFDLIDEGGDDDGDAAAPSPSKQPAKKLDKLPPVMRLNDVDEHNISKLFRFVNLAGKPRVLWWGPSALDPNVRVPQFWSVAEFKQQLCNKFGVRIVHLTDDQGEPIEKQIKFSIARAWLNSPKRRIYDGV
ncbi:MAG TPA: DNA-primase RepB domain-containing protein, partial [Pseudolabrys sp.]